MSLKFYIIECAALCAAFGALVIAMLFINPLSFISDYPPEIQERYYSSQRKAAAKGRLTKMMIAKKAFFIILGLFLFALMAHITGAVSYVQSLIAVCGYIAVLAVFDIVVLDWLIFPNVKRIRLPGTEDMNAEYRQMWFHVRSTLVMLPILILGAPISAGIMVWIW
ncbi:MAG: hypothetical protein LUF26_08610 [Firmicutes bacterium]|nr:hypothetical protein [Bacillota bacterium]